MEPSENPEGRQRGTCLPLMLAWVFANFSALVLVVATGGWVGYVIGVVLAIFLFGTIHYLLWGRSLLRQTAAEREEEEMRKRIEDMDKEPPEHGSNGFTRRGAGL
jgi:uncharacterized protein (DUF58 family)